MLRAAANGHEKIVKILLETGRVNVGWKDNSGVTALSLAAKNGDEIIAKVLSDAEIVNMKDKHAFAPIACETSKGGWW